MPYSTQLVSAGAMVEDHAGGGGDEVAGGRFVLSRGMGRAAFALMSAGAVTATIGFALAPTRTWLNLLVDGFYLLSLGVSAVIFVAAQRLAGAKSSATHRHVPQALMQVLPVAAVLMVVIAFCFDKAPDALVDAARTTWLTPWFVYERMAIIIVLWLVFARGFRKRSRGATVFTWCFAVAFAAAAYDWLVSMDSTWPHAMFGVYAFAGCFVQGIAAVCLVTVVLTRRGELSSPGARTRGEPTHAMGTMLLASSTFWAYIWIFQYGFIWYSQVAEEVTWFQRRTTGAWLPVFLLSFVVNWVIPFCGLLPRGAKRSMKTLAAMCALMLAGRWLDLVILVMPSQLDTPRFGLLELGMAAGCAGLGYLIVVRALSRARSSRG